MRNDVSAAWSPRALSWQIYFAACLVGVGALTYAISEQEPAAERIAVAGLLLAMAVWYTLFTDRPYVLHAGLLVMLIAISLMVGSAGLLLFAICPLVYMTLPVPAAHAAVVVYGLVPTVTHLLRTGDARLTATMFLPIGLGAIVVSIVAGAAVTRNHALSTQLAASQERQRLAAEIHDTVAQGLSSVVMLLQAADDVMETDPSTARKHLALAARTARENLDEARAIVGALTPSPLSDTSLVDALKRLSANFTLTGVARALGTSVEVVLLRVAQEALTNAAKHAHANRVSVALTFTETGAVLEVRDDGVGFDPSATASGYGLGGMRARVEQIGGRLIVHSGTAGTTVRAEVES